ncbi:MAG: hypothetical protein MO852_03465 [Candidatus Devosia euplotis]|nr:hypothetical protein [Candidatus Devosia euplotis]
MPGAPDLKITEGTLRFENVHFTYTGATHPTLDGISFEARAGQTIGIVGVPAVASPRSPI